MKVFELIELLKTFDPDLVVTFDFAIKVTDVELYNETNCVNLS